MNTKAKKSTAIKFVDKVIGEPITLGSTLEALRLADEESQTSYAKKLGIPQSHLSAIEKGIKGVTPERARHFAKKLGFNEITFVELALQDQLARVGMNVKVKIVAA